MRRLIIHSPLFRILTPPIIGLLAYLIILLFYNDLTVLVSFFESQELYLVILLSYLLFESGRILIGLMSRFFPFEKHGVASIILQTILGLLVIYFLVSGVLALYFNFFVKFSPSSNLKLVFNWIFLSTAIMYQLFYFGLFFLNRKHESRIKEEIELNEDILESMARFKNEINPKMLYESLETLILLSRKDPDKADEFINDLSSIYRYILSNKQSELVSISEEMEMTQRLVKLLNFRMYNNIKFGGELKDGNEDLELIPGTLPKLLERIVENTIISDSYPLNISCEYEKDSEYIVLKYPLNEKLLKDDNSIIDEIQRSYSFLSNKPLVNVKAYGFGYIKIPAIGKMSE